VFFLALSSFWLTCDDFPAGEVLDMFLTRKCLLTLSMAASLPHL
jgi:hypothetical protein